jgi:dipeptidase E
MTKRQLLTMGGGGFLMEPENPLLDDFFFQLSGKQKPKVCFVSTAGGDAQTYIDKFYDGMWGLDRILREAYEAGVVLGGISAGSICWFEEGVTDSIPGTLSALKCLGFLSGSNCVHYDGESERRPSYQRLISNGMKPGYACDDGVAGYFVNERLVEFVSSRPQASAYRLDMTDSQISEQRIKPRYLG